jgi:hypothetical protein
MLLTDQVAIAPCTDCVQAHRPTFEGKAERAGARVRVYEIRSVYACGTRGFRISVEFPMEFCPGA